MDLSFCRGEFPSLKLRIQEQPVAYFDGPGGTQVPQRVIEAMVTYLTRMNANTHGAFPTSAETDAMMTRARTAVADLLGAASPREIAFGQNMTTLNFSLARAISRTLRPGDEIVVTELDHDANVAPWLALAEQGAVIRWVRMDSDTCTLDMADLEQKLSGRTRVLAIGHAANATGTVNDVVRATRLAKAVGALVVVDAVHSVPHLPVDVTAIGCDFLLCSAYKFFGPHVGILYARSDAFASLPTYKVRPQSDEIPYRIETGTLNHEGIAGTEAAISFLADLARAVSGTAAEPAPPGTPERRRQLRAAMAAIETYEGSLAARLLEGLGRIQGVRVYGPPPGHPRTPTVCFTLRGHSPASVAGALGREGLFVWDGHFYARTAIERLGLAQAGGLVRVGMAPYSTAAEVDRLLAAIARLA